MQPFDVVVLVLAVACAAETGAVIAAMMFPRAIDHEAPGHALGAAGR